MNTMNAARFNRFGDPAKVISTQQAAMPDVGANDVLIKMRMSPIHNHDLLMVRGEYGVKPELPTTGGTEGTGTIVALGADVNWLEVGMRVAVAGVEHTWAEYFTVPAASVVPVPDGIDDSLAAQILGMPLGSVLALNQFAAAPGDWIIVNAANGAVGKVIAAVGRARGLRVALLVRRESARKELMTLGFHNIFVTSKKEWKKSLQDVIGESRVAGGVDMVGGKAADEIVSFISEHGLFLSFGAMTNEPLELNPSTLIFKQITVRGFWSYKEFQLLSVQEIRQMIDELFALAALGTLKLPVDQLFPLDQVAQAMAASAQSRSGKVLIAA